MCHPRHLIYTMAFSLTLTRFIRLFAFKWPLLILLAYNTRRWGLINGGKILFFSNKEKKAERAKRTAVKIYFPKGLRVPILFSCFGSSHLICAKRRQCCGCCYTMHMISKDRSRVKTKRKHKEMKQESLVFTILSVLHCTTSPNLTVVFTMSDLPLN